MNLGPDCRAHGRFQREKVDTRLIAAGDVSSNIRFQEAESQCRYEFLAEHHSPVRPEQIASLDAVLSLTPGWKAETFDAGAERLLIVARFGVGYDMCDEAALTANNVLLTITPGATDLPVAGGVLAMMLALSRRLFTKDRPPGRFR